MIYEADEKRLTVWEKDPLCPLTILVQDMTTTVSCLKKFCILYHRHLSMSWNEQLVYYYGVIL